MGEREKIMTVRDYTPEEIAAVEAKMQLNNDRSDPYLSDEERERLIAIARKGNRWPSDLPPALPPIYRKYGLYVQRREKGHWFNIGHFYSERDADHAIACLNHVEDEVCGGIDRDLPPVDGRFQQKE